MVEMTMIGGDGNNVCLMLMVMKATEAEGIISQRI